ncbi:hypothetical protein BDZ97DRAFT_2035254 [Flammula alnicola]|nr:hypothetical protein BDZ97DRAFT_2035254 [Flammula alnicola]
MSSSDIQVQYVTRASQFPSFAKDVLEADPVKSNVILPTLNKCIAKERNGQTPNDHLWIVVYTSREVLFIASCTDGYMGKYPIFLFTPIPYSRLRRDTIVPALCLLARTLHRHVSRVYSVFGPEIVARTFCSLWTQRTGIPEVLEPYYLAKISFATPETLINRRLPSFPDELIELRPASREDIPALSELCYLFAGESPPFVLEPVSAMQEANILVMNGEAWVHTVSRPGQPTRIASMVAFTRNTDRMATITKLYTHPDFHVTGSASASLGGVAEGCADAR